MATSHCSSRLPPSAQNLQPMSVAGEGSAEPWDYLLVECLALLQKSPIRGMHSLGCQRTRPRQGSSPGPSSYMTARAS